MAHVGRKESQGQESLWSTTVAHARIAGPSESAYSRPTLCTAKRAFQGSQLTQSESQCPRPDGQLPDTILTEFAVQLHAPHRLILPAPQ